MFEASNTTDLGGSRDGRVRAPKVIITFHPCAVEEPLETPLFDLRVGRQFLFREGGTDKPLRPENE